MSLEDLRSPYFSPHCILLLYLYAVWHSIARTCRRRPGLNWKQQYPHCPFVCLINMLISSLHAEIKSPENTPELRVNPLSSLLYSDSLTFINYSPSQSVQTPIQNIARCPRRRAWEKPTCEAKTIVLLGHGFWKQTNVVCVWEITVCVCVVESCNW